MTFRNLTVDSPVNLGSTYVFDKNDRRKIDEQIRELQAAMLDTSLTGQNLTTCRVASGTTFVAGDVCCLSGAPARDDGIPIITTATTAHLVIAGAVLGVVMAAAPQDSLVLVALSGVLPPSITGLTVAGPVVCDALGKLVHVASFGSGDLKMGQADASLNLTLQIGVIDAGGGGGPVTFNNVKSALATANTAVDYNNQQQTGVAAGTSATHAVNKAQLDIHVPPGWFNVKNYGAVGDGVTNDLPAVVAAMAAAGNPFGFSNAGQGTVFFPPGTYYLNGDLEIEGQYVFQGSGAGWYGDSSKLKFAPYKGIRCYTINNSPSGGYGEYATFRNLYVLGGHQIGGGLDPAAHPIWQATHAYSVGDKIVPTSGRVADTNTEGRSFEFYYECITAGTSSGTQPVWQDDNTGYFTHKAKLWANGVYKYYGNTVYIASRPAVIFMCVDPTLGTAGKRTSGVVPGGFAGAAIGTTVTETGPDGNIVWLCCNAASQIVTDGTVTWARRNSSGITPLCRVLVEHCAFDSFLNAGIHLQAASTTDNSLGFAPYYVNWNFVQPSSNCNICQFNDVKVMQCGVGVFANGPDANACTFVGCNILLSGVGDRQIGISDRSFLGNQYQGFHLSGSGGPAISVRGAVNSSAFAQYYIEGDCGPSEIRSTSVGFGPGGFKGSYDAASTGHGAFAPGDWRGVSGQSTTAGSVGINSYLKYDADSAFGWDQAAAEAGGSFKLAYIDSWMGRGWWSLVQSNARAAYGLSNQRAPEGFGLIRFPNGWVEGSESDKRLVFATAAAYIDSGLRFGKREVGDIVRANAYAVSNKFAERTVVTAGYAAGGVWTATTAVTSGNHSGPYAGGGTMVTPTVSNGYVYECTKAGTTGGAQPTWPTTPTTKFARTWVSGGDYWALNSYTIPTTPNGKIYKATAISGGRPESYSSTEPTWPTTIGNTVVDASGITWTCDSVDLFGTERVVDGTAIWTCVGPLAVTNRSGLTVDLTGQAGKAIVVNGGADGVSFATAPATPTQGADEAGAGPHQNYVIPTTPVASVRFTNGTSAAIGGLVAPSPAYPQVVYVINDTPGTLTINHQDTGSTAANRINTGIGGNYTSIVGGKVGCLVYDVSTSRWRLFGYPA